MVIDYSIKIVLIMSICSVGCAIEDPCPNYIPKSRVVDICQPSFATEDTTEVGENFDSVSIRVATQTDNCTCHAAIVDTNKTFTIYIKAYKNVSAPNIPNCGLEVDVYKYSNTIPSVSCTSGLATSSLGLDKDEQIFFTTRAKSSGNFTKGYCIQIIKVHQIGISGTLQVSCGSYKPKAKFTTESNTEVMIFIDSLQKEKDVMSVTYIAVACVLGGIAVIFVTVVIVIARKRHQRRLKFNTPEQVPPNPEDHDADYGLHYNTMYVGSDPPQHNGATDYATIEDTMGTEKSEKDNTNKDTESDNKAVFVDEINVEGDPNHQYSVVNKNKGEFCVQDGNEYSNSSHEYAVFNKIRNP